MKSIELLCRRAVVLLTFSDRCSLEESIADGIYHSLEEREEQREAINEWLIKNGYSPYITKEEKDIFDTKIEEEINYDILAQGVSYEAIEPILWTLGLVRTTSKFDEFIIKDFHPMLQISRNHSFENLVKSCKIREKDEIVEKREIAMLWHWRSVEAKRNIFKEKNAKDIILSIFGLDYNKYLKKIKFTNGNVRDFCVNSKPFFELNSQEINQLQTITYWRHLSFEWILSDDEWEDTDVST